MQTNQHRRSRVYRLKGFGHYESKVSELWCLAQCRLHCLAHACVPLDSASIALYAKSTPCGWLAAGWLLRRVLGKALFGKGSRQQAREPTVVGVLGTGARLPRVRPNPPRENLGKLRIPR